MTLRRIIITVATVIAVGLLSLVGCGVFISQVLMPCEEVEISRYHSPDRHRVAVVSRGNCGATTAFSTHVALELVERHSWLSNSKQVVRLRNLHNLKPIWLGNRTLRINLPPNTKVYDQEMKAVGVTIEYVPPVSSAIAIPGELPRWCGARLTTNYFRGPEEDIIVRLSGHLKRRIIRSEIWHTANEQPRTANVPVWVLELDFETPVLVEADGGGPPKRWITVREIGLVGDGYTLPVADKYSSLSDRHVLVTGALRTARWTWEPSPVSMDEKKVELAGLMTCDGRPIATN